MKMLFCDFDGTLVSHGKLMHPEDLLSIKKLREAGNYFIICTGRSIQEIKRELPELKVPFDYLILNNGAELVDSNYQTIDRKSISKEIGISILDDLLMQEGISIYYGNEKENYGFHHRQVINQSNQKIMNLDFKSQYHQSKDFSILCFAQDNEKTDVSEVLIKKIQEKYGQDVEIYLNTYFVDIVPKGCSKGNSIALFKEIMQIDGTSYAIGDSYNDLSMIKSADYGYTFNHAEIKKDVLNTVDSVNQLINIMLGD